MSYGFENQISAVCDNYILFCTFFILHVYVAVFNNICLLKQYIRI